MNTAAFWAILHYSHGNARGAITLLDTALTIAPRIGSERLTAMLYARACRAHARAGDTRAADRAADAALTAYDRTGPVTEDPGCVYWVNRGEIHQLLGSSSLNLHYPATALSHFQNATTAHAEAYDGDASPALTPSTSPASPKPTSTSDTSTPQWSSPTRPSTAWAASHRPAAPAPSPTYAANWPVIAASPPSETSSKPPVDSSRATLAQRLRSAGEDIVQQLTE
ncbi:hypothetical protein [Actinacidiphila paucisporea]|uniref:Tetratricopeptide repeat protein n=1 Tax=Actinacidiphila paucisporea TaxID=310782 RepID=A0A1M7Q8T6_9ACTN|nr:hypothetical protein [Actinacidiphila paucisporea]SHN26705.1 hypothetical protein SAMN05216499_13048 [Actinacidiphila paucisporea]